MVLAFSGHLVYLILQQEVVAYESKDYNGQNIFH